MTNSNAARPNLTAVSTTTSATPSWVNLNSTLSTPYAGQLMLAQNGSALDQAVQSGPTGAQTNSTAPDTAATETAAAGGFDFMTMMIFGVLLALIVSTFLGGRREKKKFQEMMSSIKKNDEVRTVGGIIGSVVEVKPDVVILKIDENSNTKVTIARGKIEAVIKAS